MFLCNDVVDVLVLRSRSGTRIGLADDSTRRAHKCSFLMSAGVLSRRPPDLDLETAKVGWV